MRELIATFYSHFGAVRFMKWCKEQNWAARMMPVPRSLSSSCGTCVRFACDVMHPQEQIVKETAIDEIEQIVEIMSEEFREIYRAQNS